MNSDSFRNRKNGFETMDGGKSEQSGGPKGTNPTGKIIGIVAAIAILAVLALNSTYEIKEQEQAVLTTFGIAKNVTGAPLQDSFHPAGEKGEHHHSGLLHRL